MADIQKYSEQTFESIKHINEYRQEFWYARELQTALEYSEWRNFKKIIDKAKDACATSGNPVEDHFVDVTKWSQSVQAQSEKLTIMFFHGMPAI